MCECYHVYINFIKACTYLYKIWVYVSTCKHIVFNVIVYNHVCAYSKGIVHIVCVCAYVSVYESVYVYIYATEFVL